ncbi:MAG TPA: 3-hydroxyacyl-CoA dehydrogenase NAD-binding domain-containing protein [Sphingomonas sp.]|nr:3-hydroxyacyl-CoA dehydrogenase NAD-binding domain-containing protein [Sphingomonas sp.]
MAGSVSFEVHGLLAEAVIDHPPVNAASHGVRAGLLAAIERFEGDEALDVLLIRCAGRTFMAGADLKEFGKPMGEPTLPALLARIDRASKPVIAAIHGAALGGGLELALACHYRIADKTARLGFPEVKLGLLPGAGGTQRTPRLAGLEVAIAMVAEGRELGAEEARAAGLIDEVADGDLVPAARAFARKVVSLGTRRSGDLPMPPDDPDRFEEARRTLARRKRGQPAPLMALDAIRLGYTLPFDEALEREYALCREAVATPESRALRHLFAAERLVTRPPSDASPRPIATAGVIGLGAMGRGIAIALAEAGVPTVAVGPDEAQTEAARQAIATYWEKKAAKGGLDPAEARARLDRIRFTADIAALADADLVIEAVSEDMAVKQAVFADLGRVAKPGAILASNTSYLDIDALADASGRPADVCGMHFFNPAQVMRLLECVRGRRTAPEVIAVGMSFARRIGKLPVLSGVCDGFIVNRLLAKRSREAFFLIEEGTSPAAIDRVMTDFGFPMGPLALGDLAGLDVQHAARQARFARLTPREQRIDFIGRMTAAGRLGQKSGAGWYRYEDRRPLPDPETDRMIADHAERHGLALRPVDDAEIRERLLYAMVNEGARLIDERVVPRPHEVDVAMVHGVGFPAHRGGPLFWADTIGLGDVLAAIKRFREQQGDDYWTPSPLLVGRAAEGRGFYG